MVAAVEYEHDGSLQVDGQCAEAASVEPPAAALLAAKEAVEPACALATRRRSREDHYRSNDQHHAGDALVAAPAVEAAPASNRQVAKLARTVKAQGKQIKRLRARTATLENGLSSLSTRHDELLAAHNAFSDWATEGFTRISGVFSALRDTDRSLRSYTDSVADALDALGDLVLASDPCWSDNAGPSC